MEKREIIEFFDRCAPTWDAEQADRNAVIEKILDNAKIKEGMSVLDVACGTGVMFPFYLRRGVGAVTGIDISPEMARLAQQKYPGDARVEVICGDVEEAAFENSFDAVMIYNAFPHFPDPRRLIKALAAVLKTGGSLTVAHGMSREKINAHHEAKAHKVSNGLMEAQELKALFEPYFDVTVVMSTDEMYQVTGVKR